MLNPDNGHYYRLVSTNLSWSAANAQAHADGGYLATITSQAEQDFVGPMAAGHRAWLGAGSTDDANGTGHFFWLTGPEAGTSVSYTHWRAGGEPNGGFGSTEYIHIEGVDDAANGGWNDAPDTSGGRDFIEEWGGRPGDPFVGTDVVQKGSCLHAEVHIALICAVLECIEMPLPIGGMLLP